MLFFFSFLILKNISFEDALQILKGQEIQLVEEEKNSGSNKNTKTQMSPNSKQNQNNRYRHSVNDAELEV